MALVYVAEPGSTEKVDYKIMRARLPKEADMTICETADEPLAAGREEVWCFTKSKDAADFSVAWIDDEASADFKIWKTANTFKAKWEKEHPLMGTLLK